MPKRPASTSKAVRARKPNSAAERAGAVAAATKAPRKHTPAPTVVASRAKSRPKSSDEAPRASSHAKPAAASAKKPSIAASAHAASAASKGGSVLAVPHPDSLPTIDLPPRVAREHEHTRPKNHLMTVIELAQYLRLEEQQVVRLAMVGKLPGVQLEGSWRFRQGEVDQWVSEQIVGENESFTDVPDGMQVPLDDLMPDTAIIPQLRAKDGVGVIEELAAKAYANGWLNDKPWFIGALVERESLASTAMEGGVAFLHTRAKDKGKINRPFVILGRSWEGISFGAPDGKPTYLFFLLGLRYDKLHLPILGRLARALRVPATIAKLRSLSSPHQIRALLLREDESVRAGNMPAMTSATFEPKLDRIMRLRSIRRLDTMRRTKQAAADKARDKAAKRKAKAKAKAKPSPSEV